eukprot:UN07490
MPLLMLLLLLKSMGITIAHQFHTHLSNVIITQFCKYIIHNTNTYKIYYTWTYILVVYLLFYAVTPWSNTANPTAPSGHQTIATPQYLAAATFTYNLVQDIQL